MGWLFWLIDGILVLLFGVHWFCNKNFLVLNQKERKERKGSHMTGGGSPVPPIFYTFRFSVINFIFNTFLAAGGTGFP